MVRQKSDQESTRAHLVEEGAQDKHQCPSDTAPSPCILNDEPRTHQTKEAVGRVRGCPFAPRLQTHRLGERSSQTRRRLARGRRKQSCLLQRRHLTRNRRRRGSEHWVERPSAAMRAHRKRVLRRALTLRQRPARRRAEKGPRTQESLAHLRRTTRGAGSHGLEMLGKAAQELTEA